MKRTTAESEEVVDGVGRHGGKSSLQLPIDHKKDSSDDAKAGEEVFSEEIVGVGVNDAQKNDGDARGLRFLAGRDGGSVLEEELLRRKERNQRRGVRRRGR